MKRMILSTVFLCGLAAASSYAQEDTSHVKAIDMGLSVDWADRYLTSDLSNALDWSTFFWGSPIANIDIAENRDMGSNICGTNYDPATARLGIGWRLPTAEECRELAELPVKLVTTPANGQLVTAENGNELFFKAYSGFNCSAWTGNANNSTMSYPRLGADVLKITTSGSSVVREGRSSSKGNAVRPVKVKQIGDIKVETVTLSDSEVTLMEGKNTIVWSTTLPETASNRWLDWTSDNSEIATVDKVGRIMATSEGTTVVRAVTTDGSNIEQTVTVNVTGLPKKDVDMGLSVEWGAYNVGATANTELGEYFSWGQIESKTVFPGYPYFTNLPTTNISGTEYDAATAIWGKEWRTPTRQEWEELVNNSTIESPYTLEGVTGALFTSKINGNSIFLPATGYITYSYTNDSDIPVYMTSEAKSTVNRQTDFYAFRVDKGETTFPEYAGGNGYTVRAVRTASTSAIDEITAESEAAIDVYNLAGQRLISGGSQASLRNLAPGIYIVRQGRKVMKLRI